MTNTLTIKINQCAEQLVSPVRKLYGLLPAKSLIALLDIDDLAANPRSAKKGSVTAEIEETLRETPELFPAKTKGILLASSSYRSLDRDRYQLKFVNPDSEGMLDGGHNALAAGRFILHEAGLSERDLRKVKDWVSFRAAWNENKESINQIADVLSIEMPVEVQVPADLSDSDIVDNFRISLLEIAAARNNNVQLTEETKANKKGFYNVLKQHVPPTLRDAIEWKTNDGGRIRVRDIIALSWVPLSKLELPNNIRVNPNQIYRNKGVCVSAFNELLENKDVASSSEGTYEVTIRHVGVLSALKIAGQLPEIYDLLYEEIPSAYNGAGGSFGKISAVKIYDEDKLTDKSPKYLRLKPHTPYQQNEVKYTCPDGFIIPLLYGMRALLETNPSGILQWVTDPRKFLKKHLPEIMRHYRLVIEMAQWDPQKVGKNISAYQFADSTISATLINSSANPR